MHCDVVFSEKQGKILTKCWNVGKSGTRWAVQILKGDSKWKSLLSPHSDLPSTVGYTKGWNIKEELHHLHSGSSYMSERKSCEGMFHGSVREMHGVLSRDSGFCSHEKFMQLVF